MLGDLRQLSAPSGPQFSGILFPWCSWMCLLVLLSAYSVPDHELTEHKTQILHKQLGAGGGGG